jgi:hypothetical protein
VTLECCAKRRRGVEAPVEVVGIILDVIGKRDLTHVNYVASPSSNSRLPPADFCASTVLHARTCIVQSLLTNYRGWKAYRDAMDLNYLLLVVCILVVVGLVLYLFYWNRLLGFVFSLALRLWGWKAGNASVWVQFRESYGLALSPLQE